MPRIVGINIPTTVGTLAGGSTTTSALTLKSTTGVGTTNADIIFQVGNNGATEAMRILNSGNVGIGTNTPTAKLHVSGTALNLMDIYGATAGLISRRANGTSSSPTAVALNDIIGLYGGRGYGATGFTNISPGLRVVADEAFTDSTASSRLEFHTTSVLSTIESMRIDSIGNVGIGVTPAAKLQVKLATNKNFVMNVGSALPSGVRLEAVNDIYNANIPLELRGTQFAFSGPTTTTYIDTAGNFGVGTSPAKRFHVYETSVDTVFRLENGTTGKAAFLDFKNFTGTVIHEIGIDTNGGNRYGAADALVIWGNGAKPLLLGTNSTERMRIDSAGKVIIASAPADGQFNLKGGRSYFSANSEKFAIGARYIDTGGTVYFGAANDGTGGATLPDATICVAGGGEIARFANSGNVGIGTITLPKKFNVYSNSPDTHVYLSDNGPSLSFGNNASIASSTITMTQALATTGGQYSMSAGDFGLLLYGASRGNIRIDSNYSGAGTTHVLLQPTSGNVGIGASPSNAKLHISGSVGYTPATYSGAQGNGFWNTGLTAAVNASIYATNSLVASGVFSPSDARLKKDITPITGIVAMDFINNAIPVNFNWKSDNQSDYGFIAQDLLLKGYSHLVTAISDADLHAEDNYGIASPEGERFILKYDSIIPILAAAIKELSAKNNALEARLLAAGI